MKNKLNRSTKIRHITLDKFGTAKIQTRQTKSENHSDKCGQVQTNSDIQTNSDQSNAYKKEVFTDESLTNADQNSDKFRTKKDKSRQTQTNPEQFRHSHTNILKLSKNQTNSENQTTSDKHSEKFGTIKQQTRLLL